MSEGIPGTPVPPDPSKPEPRERLVIPKKPVVVFNIGGTALDELIEGRLTGRGILGDEELAEMERTEGLNIYLEPSGIKQKERSLVDNVYERMSDARKIPVDASEALAWAVYKSDGKEERFSDFVEGPFITLFSGQSAHLRSALIAPIVSILIDQVIREPNRQVLGIIGTDFGPDAVLPMIDVLVYDTHLPTFIFSGTIEPKLPQNIIDMAVATRINIPRHMLYRERFWRGNYSGSYWVFEEEIFSAGSLIKFDPRGIGLKTFISPHNVPALVSRSNRYVVGSELRFGPDGNSEFWEQETSLPPEDHITRRLSMSELYNALDKVGIVDLGDQNPVWEQVQRIINPEIPAVVVATHGLGSVNNVIKTACAEAVRRGKLVISVSRAEAGEIDSQDVQSLIDINRGELEGTGASVLDGHKLNKTVAKALLVRALLEGRDQARTQALIDDYSIARGLL